MRRDPDGGITLSVRNLQTLLAKADQPGSARTLVGGEEAPGLMIRVETDAEHYDGRPAPPGVIHPETAARIARRVAANTNWEAS